MGFFHDTGDEALAHQEVNGAGHKAELSHELIAAAASYEVRPASLSVSLSWHCADRSVHCAGRQGV